MTKPSIVVKRYRNEGAYCRDAVRMWARGYEVVSTTSETPGRGCGFVLLAMLTLGLWLLLIRPRPVLVVTYRARMAYKEVADEAGAGEREAGR